MSGRSSSSEDDSSADSLLFSGSSMGSESHLRCCSSLVEGLGIWLHPGAISVEGLLMKHLLLSLPGSKIVAIVPDAFLGL
jgi:hypothetical protein